MTTVRMTLNIFGDNFSPAAFIKDYKGGLFFSETHEKGQISSLRNEPLDYGYASADCSDKPVNWEETEEFINEVANLKNSMALFGIEEVDISCTVYDDGQCTMQFDPDYMAKLCSVGASLAITCERS